ncbi:hypothetical protein TNCV_2234161 [Trichonephila clavipes]|nr:hypothetical protein TNCV_2234161 [Trichonephila clavipes]
MSNSSLNAEYVAGQPSNKLTPMPGNASDNAIYYCNRTFARFATCCLVATGSENPDKRVELKAIQSHPGNSRLRCEASEIQIQTLVP